MFGSGAVGQYYVGRGGKESGLNNLIVIGN